VIRFRDFVTDRLDRLGRFACGLARDRSPGLILAIAVALAFVLRAGFLLLWPVTPHEVHYLREARQVLSAGSVRAMAGSVHAWLPALAYARVLEVFPSADERDLRWIQLAFSLATLGVIHWIGRRAVSPRAGACAAMVFALTPQAIYYGASCEPYSSHLFLTALLLALYASAWRAPSVVGSLAMVTVGTVAIFHHLLAALVLGILAVHALFVNGAPRRTRVLVPVRHHSLLLLGGHPRLAGDVPRGVGCDGRPLRSRVARDPRAAVRGSGRGLPAAHEASLRTDRHGADEPGTRCGGRREPCHALAGRGRFVRDAQRAAVDADMIRPDPTVHLNYLVSGLLVGFALERLVPAPRTLALVRVIGAVRHLERWLTDRVPVLKRKPKLWCELAWLGIALVFRGAVFVLVDSLIGP
jgi:hypothetical protein